MVTKGNLCYQSAKLDKQFDMTNNSTLLKIQKQINNYSEQFQITKAIMKLNK